MTEFRSRPHAQFQARIWREYATVRQGYAERVIGLRRDQCLARARAALAWLRDDRARAHSTKESDND